MRESLKHFNTYGIISVILIQKLEFLLIEVGMLFAFLTGEALRTSPKLDGFQERLKIGEHTSKMTESIA